MLRSDHRELTTVKLGWWWVVCWYVAKHRLIVLIVDVRRQEHDGGLRPQTRPLPHSASGCHVQRQGCPAND